MGRITVAAFKPKPGMEAELLAVIADRLPLLRGLGLSTDRASVLMRAGDGVIIEISEWASEEAIAKAHQTPEVLALWDRFWACCEPVSLDSLEESRAPFGTFEALD